MRRDVSQKIGEEGALPYMIGLLRSPDERIQEQVLASLISWLRRRLDEMSEAVLVLLC